MRSIHQPISSQRTARHRRNFDPRLHAPNTYGDWGVLPSSDCRTGQGAQLSSCAGPFYSDHVARLRFGAVIHHAAAGQVFTDAILELILLQGGVSDCTVGLGRTSFPAWGTRRTAPTGFSRSLNKVQAACWGVRRSSWFTGDMHWAAALPSGINGGHLLAAGACTQPSSRRLNLTCAACGASCSAGTTCTHRRPARPAPLSASTPWCSASTCKASTCTHPWVTPSSVRVLEPGIYLENGAEYKNQLAATPRRARRPAIVDESIKSRLASGLRI